MLWLEVGKQSSKKMELDAIYPVTKLTFTCSTSTIKTLEKGVKYHQS